MVMYVIRYCARMPRCVRQFTDLNKMPNMEFRPSYCVLRLTHKHCCRSWGKYPDRVATQAHT